MAKKVANINIQPVVYQKDTNGDYLLDTNGDRIVEKEPSEVEADDDFDAKIVITEYIDD